MGASGGDEGFLGEPGSGEEEVAEDVHVRDCELKPSNEMAAMGQDTKPFDGTLHTQTETAFN